LRERVAGHTLELVQAAGPGISSEESFTGAASGIETTLARDLFSDAPVEFHRPGRL
jgi:hypothetical protein